MVCLSATWENVTEHVAEPSIAWGSRGRRFKSCQPDKKEALTSGNPGQGFDLCLWSFEPPPENPPKTRVRNQVRHSCASLCWLRRSSPPPPTATRSRRPRPTRSPVDRAAVVREICDQWLTQTPRIATPDDWRDILAAANGRLEYARPDKGIAAAVARWVKSRETRRLASSSPACPPM
jgi:hypothetical protein